MQSDVVGALMSVAQLFVRRQLGHLLGDDVTAALPFFDADRAYGPEDGFAFEPQ